MRAALAILAAALLAFASPAPAQAPNACDVVKRDAVERAIGVPLKEGRKLMANCIFEAQSGNARVIVQVGFPGPLTDFADRQRSMQLAGAKLEPVAGLGDAASWAAGPDHLIVSKAGHVLDIDPGLAGAGAAKERALAIGRAVLPAIR